MLEMPKAVRTGKPSSHAFRAGVLIAMSNPKSLIYIVALLPPFVDAGSLVVPQLVILAIVAMSIDVVLGAAYIFAGNGLACAIAERGTRIWVDRAVGAIFIAIALAIFTDLLLS